MKKILPVLSLTLLMTACGPPKTEGNVSLSADPAIDLRVTSEIETGLRATAITVMPNDAAQWLAQVVMIDEDGKLYQSGLSARKARPMSGTARDIAGIMRRGAAGLVLTITPEGSLGGFIESDDLGTLLPLTVSAPQQKFESFCVTDTAPENTVYVRTNNGALALDIDVIDNQAVTLSISGDQLQQCPKTQSLFAQENGAYALPLRLQNGRAVTLTNGITIQGADDLLALYSTTENLGGPYNKGAILAADADTDRILTISLEFAQKILAPKTPE